MAVYAGYSLNGEVILAEDFQWVWEEAIKQIQFAIGDAETNAYGALPTRRATAAQSSHQHHQRRFEPNTGILSHTN